MTGNLKELCSLVSEKADALLLISPVNRRYVVGFSSSDGYVIVKKGEIFFITDFRYFESVHIKQEEGMVDKDIKLVLQNSNVWFQLKELLSDCKTVMFEDSFVSVALHDKMKLTFADKELVSGGSKILCEMRSKKSKFELECIKRAQSITDKTFSYMLSFISDNVGKNDFTEKALALELEYFMLKNGSDGIAFDTIAVSSRKSSLPHGVPEDIPVSRGFLTMDFGARFDGYCSDMTRTVYIGKPSEEEKKVYNTVLCAQNAAFSQIRAGVVGSNVDKAARDIIENSGYKGAFGHSLGHSLGLEIHEGPNFSPHETGKIPLGAVLSVEPGIYLEGKYGVRIEDIVYVKQHGFENLTHSSKDFIVI